MWCIKSWSSSWNCVCEVAVAVVPGVARLLRSAALQLLHQHLAAPSQSIADLPERAAAAQGTVTVLGRGGDDTTRDKNLTLNFGSPGWKNSRALANHTDPAPLGRVVALALPPLAPRPIDSVPVVSPVPAAAAPSVLQQLHHLTLVNGVDALRGTRRGVRRCFSAHPTATPSAAGPVPACGTC